MYFFQYYFRSAHMQDYTILLLNEYEITGVLSGKLSDRFDFKRPDGTSLEDVLKKSACETMEIHIKKIYSCKDSIMVVWDNAIQEVLNILCQNYEIAFNNLDNVMKEIIVPAWNEYWRDANNYGGYVIKNAVEYMRKCGKLTKEYIKLVDGQITMSDVGTVGYYVFSNRENLYQRFMKWLVERIKIFEERWRKY